MENNFASFPRYGSGGCRTTVWKTRGNASARAILYPDLRARNPAPGFMKMRAEQGVAGYAPQVARPQNADVRQRNTWMKKVLRILTYMISVPLIIFGVLLLANTVFINSMGGPREPPTGMTWDEFRMRTESGHWYWESMLRGLGFLLIPILVVWGINRGTRE